MRSSLCQRSVPKAGSANRIPAVVETSAPMIARPHQLLAKRPTAAGAPLCFGVDPFAGLWICCSHVQSRLPLLSRTIELTIKHWRPYRRPHYLATTARALWPAPEEATVRQRTESPRNRGIHTISTCWMGLSQESAYLHRRRIRPSNPAICRHRAASQSKTVSKFFQRAPAPLE